MVLEFGNRAPDRDMETFSRIIFRIVVLRLFWKFVDVKLPMLSMHNMRYIKVNGGRAIDSPSAEVRTVHLGAEPACCRSSCPIPNLQDPDRSGGYGGWPKGSPHTPTQRCQARIVTDRDASRRCCVYVNIDSEFETLAVRFLDRLSMLDKALPNRGYQQTRPRHTRGL